MVERQLTNQELDALVLEIEKAVMEAERSNKNLLNSKALPSAMKERVLDWRCKWLSSVRVLVGYSKAAKNSVERQKLITMAIDDLKRIKL